MTKVAPNNEKSINDYKKNRDKILKIMHECRSFIQIPPEYAQQFNWDQMESNLKAELPKYKEQLPAVVEKCNRALASANDYWSSRQAVISCMDYVMSMQKVNAFQIGIYSGILQKVLATQYYQMYLHGIVWKIREMLKA